jgi:hypothetical protein
LRIDRNRTARCSGAFLIWNKSKIRLYIKDLLTARAPLT